MIDINTNRYNLKSGHPLAEIRNRALGSIVVGYCSTPTEHENLYLLIYQNHSSSSRLAFLVQVGICLLSILKNLRLKLPKIENLVDLEHEAGLTDNLLQWIAQSEPEYKEKIDQVLHLLLELAKVD